MAKWGQRLVSAYDVGVRAYLVLSLWPAFFISELKIEVTSWVHPPHPEPALVLAFTSPNVVRPALTHSPMAPLVTFCCQLVPSIQLTWHEHTTASSSSSSASSPSFLLPRMNCAGGTSSFFFFLQIATNLV